MSREAFGTVSCTVLQLMQPQLANRRRKGSTYWGDDFSSVFYYDGKKWIMENMRSRTMATVPGNMALMLSLSHDHVHVFFSNSGWLVVSYFIKRMDALDLTASTFCKNRQDACKILQHNVLFLLTSFKNLARIALFLPVSLKILRFVPRFLQDLPWALGSFLSHKTHQIFFNVFCFPLHNFSKSRTIDSKSKVLRRFRKRQEWFYPNEWNKVTLDKNSFILYFFPDKSSHYTI